MTGWKNIHPDFTDELQDQWEKLDFDPEEVKEWVEAGLEPFSCQLAFYLKKSNFTPQHYSKFSSRNAQEWMDYFFPKEERENINGLEISNKNLEGHLDLSGFINLKELYCSGNRLTSINLSNNKELEWIDCSDNLLTDIDFSHQNPEKVWGIAINNNNLSLRDLSCFARFVNLKHLLIGADDEKKLKQNIYNHFYGSLEYLGNLEDLEVLDISGTDIDNGLEHLPLTSLEDFYCASKREGAKVEEIKRILMISEYEAESEDEEDNRKKVNRILAYQLFVQRSHNIEERKRELNSFFRLLKQAIIRIKHKVNYDDLHYLLSFQEEAVLLSGIFPQLFQSFEDRLRKIKQELIEDFEDLTRKEIDKICQTQIKIIEIQIFLIQNRQQGQEIENLMQNTSVSNWRL